MADPSTFVNWNDYLGLNEGVGETMANRTLEEADKLQADARAAADARFGAARGAGETGNLKAYEAAGEKSRKALASYGEFMQSLKAPAARQALMEKVYGKGSVSARDAAMMGAQGAGRIQSEQRDFNKAQGYAEERDIAAGGRYSDAKRRTAAAAEEKARYEAGLQATQDRREALRKRRAQEDEDRTLLNYARTVSPGVVHDLDRDTPAPLWGNAPSEKYRDFWRKNMAERGATKGATWSVDVSGTGRWARKKTGDVRDLYDPNWRG